MSYILSLQASTKVQGKVPGKSTQHPYYTPVNCTFYRLIKDNNLYQLNTYSSTSLTQHAAWSSQLWWTPTVPSMKNLKNQVDYFCEIKSTVCYTLNRLQQCNRTWRNFMDQHFTRHSKTNMQRFFSHDLYTTLRANISPPKKLKDLSTLLFFYLMHPRVPFCHSLPCRS